MQTYTRTGSFDTPGTVDYRNDLADPQIVTLKFNNAATVLHPVPGIVRVGGLAGFHTHDHTYQILHLALTAAGVGSWTFVNAGANGTLTTGGGSDLAPSEITFRASPETGSISPNFEKLIVSEGDDWMPRDFQKLLAGITHQVQTTRDQMADPASRGRLVSQALGRDGMFFLQHGADAFLIGLVAGAAGALSQRDLAATAKSLIALEQGLGRGFGRKG